jgi:hypothetical protein
MPANRDKASDFFNRQVRSDADELQVAVEDARQPSRPDRTSAFFNRQLRHTWDDLNAAGEPPPGIGQDPARVAVELPEEPAPTAKARFSDFQDWLEKVESHLDQRGLLPGEQGYDRSYWRRAGYDVLKSKRLRKERWLSERDWNRELRGY